MKSGFTLIELLAVIVILAVIALIATPIVLNIINGAKVSSVERSAENYIDAANNSIGSAILNKVSIKDGIYTIMSNGNLCNGNVTGTTCTGVELKPELSGIKPSKGWIDINSGKIFNYSLVINNQVLNKGTTAISGNNPSSTTICTLLSGTALNIGTKYSCNMGDGKNRNFYVLEVTTDNVYLQMDKNIGGNIAWSDDPNVKSGPNVATAYLNQVTSKWISVPSKNIMLPTYQQLMDAGCGSSENIPSWCSDNLDFNLTDLTNSILIESVENDTANLNNGIISMGYWTSTLEVDYAWAFTFGRLMTANVYSDHPRNEFAGVRPVIVIDKSRIF